MREVRLGCLLGGHNEWGYMGFITLSTCLYIYAADFNRAPLQQAANNTVTTSAFSWSTPAISTK